MNEKARQTLDLIFKRPVSGNVKWSAARAMMEQLGAEIEERAGSRVAFVLNGAVMVQHKPHPSPDMDKGAVAAMREFLALQGYTATGKE